MFNIPQRYIRAFALAALIGLVAARSYGDPWTPADMMGLDLGNDAGYAVVMLAPASAGNSAINSGPISGGSSGGVLIGNTAHLNLSGGNNGAIPNGLYTDGTAVITGSLQNPYNTFSVTPAYTASALASAQNVSNYASSLTPNQTFGTITSNTTISASSGGPPSLTVINVANIQNAQLTISGGANDYFVFNLSGSLQTNQAMMLLGGVTANHILWNLTGTTGNIFMTSGGNVVFGSFLATRGGNYQFSNLDLTGQLINTAGTMQIVSGSQVDFAGFTPPSTVPDGGSTVAMFGLVMSGIAFARKRLRV